MGIIIQWVIVGVKKNLKEGGRMKKDLETLPYEEWSRRRGVFHHCVIREEKSRFLDMESRAILLWVTLEVGTKPAARFNSA